MRITISLPDDILESAEGLARLWGVSRSALFVTAMRQLVARESETRAKLDAIYGNPRIYLPSPFRAVMAKALRKARGGYEW